MVKPKGVRRETPTCTIGRPDGSRTDVYALNAGDHVLLPYLRRDGTFLPGPGIVTVTHTPNGVEVVDRHVADVNFWVWISMLANAGLQAEVARDLQAAVAASLGERKNNAGSDSTAG